jgi:hypothetical protein
MKKLTRRASHLFNLLVIATMLVGLLPPAPALAVQGRINPVPPATFSLATSQDSLALDPDSTLSPSASPASDALNKTRNHLSPANLAESAPLPGDKAPALVLPGSGAEKNRTAPEVSLLASGPLTYTYEVMSWTVRGDDGVINSSCIQYDGSLCRGWTINSDAPYRDTFQDFTIPVTATRLHLSGTWDPVGLDSFEVFTPCGYWRTGSDQIPITFTHTFDCSNPVPPGNVSIRYRPYNDRGGNLTNVRVRFDTSYQIALPPDRTPAPEDGCLANNPQARAADPVNTYTGNFTHQETDVSIPTRGLPLTFERSYNSLDIDDGLLGPGWTHSYNMRLTFDGDMAILLAPRG